jgi:hypothetical protein
LTYLNEYDCVERIASLVALRQQGRAEVGKALKLAPVPSPHRIQLVNLSDVRELGDGAKHLQAAIAMK